MTIEDIKKQIEIELAKRQKSIHDKNAIDKFLGLLYNGLKKLDTNLAENRWKDMIKYDQKNATGKSAGCACRH